MAEGGGLLNRTGSHQALTKQAKTFNFLKESHDRNSVLCLLMRREPSRSLHNLLHNPDELLHGKPSELLATHCRLAELSLRTFRTFLRELSSRRPTPPQIVPKEWGT